MLSFQKVPERPRNYRDPESKNVKDPRNVNWELHKMYFGKDGNLVVKNSKQDTAAGAPSSIHPQIGISSGLVRRSYNTPTLHNTPKPKMVIHPAPKRFSISSSNITINRIERKWLRKKEEMKER